MTAAIVQRLFYILPCCLTVTSHGYPVCPHSITVTVPKNVDESTHPANSSVGLTARLKQNICLLPAPDAIKDTAATRQPKPLALPSRVTSWPGSILL
jgi:hypothetical protein